MTKKTSKFAKFVKVIVPTRQDIRTEGTANVIVLEVKETIFENW